MRRIFLEIEYHGQHFFGWQRQGPNRTVQATLEEALADLVRHPVSVQGAGRTDRGVHALAMASHVDLDTRLSPREIRMATNARLPQDVAVKRSCEVDPRFHARFDARKKLYRYTILRSRARSPLLRDRAWLCPRPLDVAAMAEAAALLAGRHDFASFRTNPDEEDEDGPGGPEITADRIGPAAVQSGCLEPPPWRSTKPKGTVRSLFRAEMIEQGDLLLFEVGGDGFLRGMVRALAGSLVQVGLGKQSPGWIAELLERRDRRLAGANLPGHGLTLVRVEYPEEPFCNFGPRSGETDR